MILPPGEYRPDVSDYEGQHTSSILNVAPRADGYGPVKDFTIYSAALAAACRGAFRARNTDGSVTIFAGTSTKLYVMSNTDTTFSDVSKSAGTYSAIPSTDQWQFEQFGSVVIAVQANTAPQAFTLGSSSEFADLGGSPPQARYVTTVGRFLVLSGLLSNPFRVHWSGLNAITTWTQGTTQSDYQDLSGGGIVRGVSGGENGLIFQDACIRRMIYAPGSPTIFQIEKVSEEKGLFAPLSLIRAGDQTFFIAPQGFHVIAPGGYPQHIGKEKVNRTFFADVDTANLQLCLGVFDPNASRVYWAYKSLSGASGLFDKMLGYDYALQRWFPVMMSGEYVLPMSRPGVTLENLDSISPSLDALSGSLDDYSTSTLSQLALFNSAHKLGFLTGDNLEATIETAERGGDGKRIFVRGFRPITDAATVYGSVGARETTQATASYSSETLVNAVGSCPQRVSTRYGRAKVRIPAAETWTYFMGVEPDVVSEGAR